MNNDGDFTENDYSQIDAKVLLLFGEKSACVPELLRVSDWIKNKEIVFVEGGHNFFSEKPEHSAHIIKSFLQKQEVQNLSNLVYEH